MMTDADRKRLRDIRDLLSPGLYGHNAKHPHLELSMIVEGDHILVKGCNPGRKRELAFAITLASIKDGVYKAQFTPSVIALVERLDADLTPDEEKRLGL